MLELPSRHYPFTKRINRNTLIYTQKGGTQMKMRTLFFVVVAAFAGLLATGCSPQKAEQVKAVQIADGTIDPAEWGKAYPVEYEMWKKTAEPAVTPGLSKYKKGSDKPETMVDKLSEYPYLALLFNGWGFGIGY